MYCVLVSTEYYLISLMVYYRPTSRSPTKTFTRWILYTCSFMHRLLCNFTHIVVNVLNRSSKNFSFLRLAGTKRWHYKTVVYFLLQKLLSWGGTWFGYWKGHHVYTHSFNIDEDLERVIAEELLQIPNHSFLEAFNSFLERCNLSASL